MRRIRLLEICTAVPEGIAAVRVGCLHGTLLHLAQLCALRRIWKSLCDLGGLGYIAGKYGCGVKSAHPIARSYLVPLAPIGRSDHRVRGAGSLVLCNAVEVYLGLLAVLGGSGGGDAAASNLSAGIGHVGRRAIAQVGQISLQTAVCNFASDGAGDVGGTGGYGGNRVWGQCSAVARRHTAKHPANKSYAAACTHPASAVYNGITHKAVRLISTQESRQDAARRSCTACGTCRRTCTGLCRPTEHRGRVSTAFGKSGQRPGGHQHLHAHAAPCLRYGQSHGRQVAVAFLGNLQKGQRAEEPEKDVALPGGQRTSVGDVLAH